MLSLQLEIQTVEPYPTGRTSGLKRIGIWIDLCQNGPCQQRDTAKEEAGASLGLLQPIEVHTRTLLGFSSFLSQHRKHGNTGTFWQIGTHGRLMVQGLLIPSVPVSSESLRKASWGHQAHRPLAALPELNRSRIKTIFLAVQSFQLSPSAYFSYSKRKNS